MRTAPVYRAISDRLAREGCSVLTVDHHGCGDSPGDLESQSLADWAQDTLAADAQLRRDVPGRPVHWFGMGLGANVAACAANVAQFAPGCLVLWEPVFDGPAYLERLRQAHREEISREMGQSWPALLARGGELEPEFPGNVLGFPMGERLHSELLKLRDLPLHEIAQRHVRTVMSLDGPTNHDWAAAKIAGLTVQAVETPTNWLSTEAFGTAIVPQEIPRTLLATL